MGKKTPSASSESVTTMSSSPPDADDTLDSSIVSEADTTTSTDVANGGKGAKKPGLMKRMSLRREKKKEEKKEKELEKEKAKEMEKEKVKEKAKEKENEKLKAKEKTKEKDKKKDKEKKKEKDKANEKDKHKEDGQKKTADNIYTKISMDDFEAKQMEFKLWMLEQQNGSVDTLKQSKVKSFFKKFVKEWNKKRLPQRYYWSSEETPPPSRAGSRFSFAEEVQTPDFLNFPAAPVDLSNDDLDSLDESSIERSGSFSTFGKTQKPEGLNDDEATPTMPKRPLLSAVFPMVDASHENSAKVSPTVSKMMAQPVVICEDHDGTDSDPPTPTPETSPPDGSVLSHQSPVLLTYEHSPDQVPAHQSPVLLTYEHSPGQVPAPQSPVLLTYEYSPGLVNGALKERYAITPDNNNTKMMDSGENLSYEVETSNYTCMENDVLPGEELQVTEILERALQDDLMPSGELTPIAEEDGVTETKHKIHPQTVVEALQPVLMRNNNNANTVEHPESKPAETVDSSWEVVEAKTETGQVTFRGLPPPPKEWKMDPMGLTHTILPAPRPVSQEKTVTTTEVVSLPPEVTEETRTTKVIKTTTITTIEQVTQDGKTVEEENLTRNVTSPVIKSPVIAVHDNQVLPSPMPHERVSARVEKQIRIPALPEQPVHTLEREEVHSPIAVSPVTVTLEKQEPRSPGNQKVTVVGLENLEIKQNISSEQNIVTSPRPSSATFVTHELKSPTTTVEKAPVVVQESTVVERTSDPSHVEIKRSSQPDAVTLRQPIASPTHIEIKRRSHPDAVTLEQSLASPTHIEVKRTSQPETVMLDRPLASPSHIEIKRTSQTDAVTTDHPVVVGQATGETKTVTIQAKSVSIPATSHVTLAHQEVHSPVSKAPFVLDEKISTTTIKDTDGHYTAKPASEIYVFSTESSLDRRVPAEVPRQNVEAYSVSYSLPSPPVERTPVEHTTQVIRTTEVDNSSVLYREPSPGASHIPRPVPKVQPPPTSLYISTNVSPTYTASQVSNKSPRSLPPEDVRHDVNTVQMRTVQTTSVSPRQSAEIKHSVTDTAEKRRGPTLSPIIVNASTIPMLFQDAMKPVELGYSPPAKSPKSPAGSTPVKPPRSPDKPKPKPAPRPSSLRSPTSPSSLIPVAVKTEPSSPVKSPNREGMPPPKVPRPQSFKSSKNLVMVSSPPPTQTSPPARIVPPVSPNNVTASKIPPPKAPRPAKSPVTQPPAFPIQPSVHATAQPNVTVQHQVVPRAIQPKATELTSEVVTSTTNANPSQIAYTVQTTSPGPVPTESPAKPSYSKFMYEQPSFLASRTTDARRSMSRINFTPPKPSPKTRMTTSYVEQSHSSPKENVMSKSYSGPSTRREEQNRVAAPDPSFQRSEQTRIISFTQPEQVSVEQSRTTYNVNHTISPRQTSDEFLDDSLVRPEQTRKTFGPSFLRLTGDRRSLSRAEGVRFQQMQDIRETSDAQPYRQQPAPVERERPNPFQGQTSLHTLSASEHQPYRQPPTHFETDTPNSFQGQTSSRTSSTSAVRSQGANASNVVNQYLMEIKESTHVISSTGEVTEKKVRPLSQGDEEGVQMRRTVLSNVEHQNIPRETTHTAYEVTHSRGPLYGTAAYKEREPVGFAKPPRGAGGRQYASLPRGVAMGAVVVEMGPPHPARSQLEMSRSRSSYAGYPISQEFQTSGDRRSYTGYAGGPDLQTPRDRSSYAGQSPGQQGVSPSYVLSGYHAQKHLSLPRSRSSYAGTSTPSSLTPEEMARFQEVLRQKSHARAAEIS